jgi:hypothetical protein
VIWDEIVFYSRSNTKANVAPAQRAVHSSATKSLDQPLIMLSSVSTPVLQPAAKLIWL